MSRKRKNKNSKKIEAIISIIILICIAIIGYTNPKLLQDITGIQNNQNMQNVEQNNNTTGTISQSCATNIDLSTIPEYSSSPYIEINNNTPYFTEEEYITESFEKYSELDSKGRCGVAYANICKEIMPADGEERKSISSVKPTGWVNVKYDGEYLYNRCHLIGYQLSAENANEKNLITGTRYFNVEGMLPFENQVADYIDENPNNHVLYKVTPIFEGDNLVASGVEMEAYSVEDNGKGVQFNVYVYNVQPGITIDYATGKSSQN